MTSRKSIILIALGAAMGASLTGVIMWQVMRPHPNDALSLRPNATGATESETLPDEEESLPAPFTRDISGNCTLLGTVLTEDRMPVPNADVGIWLNDQPWSAPQPPSLTKTDKEGRFRLDKINGLLPFSLWAAASGFAAKTEESPECGVSVELLLSPGGSVLFTVTDAERQPVYNAEVHLFGNSLWPPRSGRTDRDGLLRVAGLDAGEYAVFAQKKDNAFASQTSFDITASNTAEVDIVLTPARPYDVRILDAKSNAPIPGAFAIVSPSPSSLLKAVVRADKAGTARVLCPVPACYLSAAAEEYLDSEAERLDPGNEGIRRLVRGGSVSGKVVDRGGAPVQGAAIQVLEEMGTSLVSLIGTEAERFHRGLLDAAAAGHPPLLSTGDDTDKIVGPITLPLPDAECAECNTPGTRPAADKTGRFVLNGLPLRRIAVSAEHPEMIADGPPLKAALDATDAVSDIVIVMKPGAKAAVRVLDERDVPILDAEVAIFDDTGRLVRDAQSDTDGYARFAGLPFGVRIEISAEGYIARVVRTDSRAKEAEIEVSLETAGRTLRGRVKDARGFGAGNVAITARLTEKGRLQVLTAVTETDGTFAMEGAGNGRYHITADGGEQGGAQAMDATYKDDIKLVLDTTKRSPDADTGGPVLIEPNNWTGGDAINEIGGEFTNNENAGADNLGVVGGADRAPSATPDTPATPEAPQSDTAEIRSSPFGEADSLPVTGPPPGKGGLPIELSGGPGKVTVTRVAIGSHVETAGLSRGARILAVNGKKVAGPADAKRSLEGPIGTVIMLEVSDSPDGSDPYTIVVQRERVP